MHDYRNHAQVEMLLSIMEEHSYLAKKQITKMGPQGNDLSEELWRSVAVQLNTLAGVDFTMDKWKEVCFILFNFHTVILVQKLFSVWFLLGLEFILILKKEET